MKHGGDGIVVALVVDDDLLVRPGDGRQRISDLARFVPGEDAGADVGVHWSRRCESPENSNGAAADRDDLSPRSSQAAGILLRFALRATRASQIRVTTSRQPDLQAFRVTG